MPSLDLISHVPGAGNYALFTPGPNTSAPLNVPHIGGVDGTDRNTATQNVAQIYNRLMLQVAAVIYTSGLTIDPDNWTQLAQAVQAMAASASAGALAAVPVATASVAGKVVLASPAEAVAGVNTAKAVTPEGLAAVIATLPTPGSYAPLTHVGGGGTQHANAVPAGAAGFMTGADKAKLDGVAAGATANPSSSSIPDFGNAVRATLLTGLVLSTADVLATDTTLQALGKLQGQLDTVGTAAATPDYLLLNLGLV